MQISDKGLLEIAEFEGIVPAPYLDSKGIWTFGIGHTAAAGTFDPATMPKIMPQNIDEAIARAIQQFKIDVARYSLRVSEAIKVPLKQHEFDALVSFDFNTGGINRAELTVAINNGSPTAADRFMGWLRPPEVRGRRTAEMNLFKSGNYDANGDTIPVWGTDGRGKLTGVIKKVNGADLLAKFSASPINTDLPLLADLEPARRVALEIEAAQAVLATAVAKLRPALKGE